MAASDEWYRTYFDRKVLDLYRSRLEPAAARREVAAVIELLGLPVDARVLDVPCGWGRHAVLLAEAGCEVTGVDLSEAALEAAEAAAERAGRRVRWMLGDMRELSFDREFDAALSLQSSLGYFVSDDDDLQVLRGIGRALRPGGRLLIETLHRDGFVADFREREEWDEHPGEPVEVERAFDVLTGVNHELVRWPDGTVKEHRMRVRTATEWQRMLSRAGFELETAHGGWDGEALEPSSPHLVMVARRSRV